MIRPLNLVAPVARLFRSLGDEGRLTLLETLIDHEQRVGDLVQKSGQSQSTVSTHLGALHTAGVVARRAEGKQAWYGVAHPSVAAMLNAAEEVVIAASEESYACVSPCCNPATGDA